MTINNFGDGKAIYLATESNASALGPVISFCKLTGVQAQSQDARRGVLQENCRWPHPLCEYDQRRGTRSIEGAGKGIDHNRVYQGTVILGPLE